MRSRRTCERDRKQYEERSDAILVIVITRMSRLLKIKAVDHCVALVAWGKGTRSRLESTCPESEEIARTHRLVGKHGQRETRLGARVARRAQNGERRVGVRQCDLGAELEKGPQMCRGKTSHRRKKYGVIVAAIFLQAW